MAAGHGREGGMGRLEFEGVDSIYRGRYLERWVLDYYPVPPPPQTGKSNPETRKWNLKTGKFFVQPEKYINRDLEPENSLFNQKNT